MPVYNGEKFVLDAINSLILQTFSDFELIISDNASTDCTEAICREVASRDSRIRYIRQDQNCGPVANFQFVLDQAVGEYFMWAAADDRRETDFLRLALLVFEGDANCGLVFCDYHVVNLDAKRPADEHAGIEYVGMFNSKKPQKQYLMRLLAPAPSLIYGLHKTSILSQIAIQKYDFFDVHLTHWYAVHSKVKIIPMLLYVSGIHGRLTKDGNRIPYSLTGKTIDPTLFFREEKKLLFQQFQFLIALPLYLLLRLFYLVNLKKLNKAIRTSKDLGFQKTSAEDGIDSEINSAPDHHPQQGAR